MKKALKITATSLLILLLLIAAALLWYRSASLPQLSGTRQINSATLQAPVKIVRDGNGVPHLFAASENQAYFALGFVHAQDRLWQLEMNRRIASGRVAEILGPAALDIDKFIRTIGVHENAARIYANLDTTTVDSLQAYADGVNAYLAQRHGPLPPEFLLTGAPAPEPWTPVDSIAWQTMLAWDLSTNWSMELQRMRLAQKLDLPQIQQFIAPYPGELPPATANYVKLYRGLNGAAEQAGALLAAAPTGHVEGIGSNNWVVDGKRSESGKPLLANDPHLGLSVPSVFYLAHLSAPGLNAVGATVPGLPVVLLGHNSHIAWGFTNTGSDVQDLYIEAINSQKPSQYRTPDGWADFAAHKEQIRIKGAEPITLTVRRTRHGPVISDVLNPARQALQGDGSHVITLRWTALEPDDKTVRAGIALGKATDWASFRTALRDFHSPQQNMVYADDSGNIGFIAPGRVPLRRRDNDLHGMVPAPGWEARYDWGGFIPFDALPQQYNPAQGWIASANQKIVPDDYPYFLTSEWGLPYRYDRIAALLQQKPRHTLDSFAAIQADTRSQALLDLLLTLLAAPPADDASRQAMDQLRNWDGTMDTDHAEPLLATAWLRQLSKMIFEPPLGKALFDDYWEHRSVQQTLLNVLHNVDGEAAWCKDKQGQGDAACQRLITAALPLALAELRQRYGKDAQDWRWGDAHHARFEHRPFTKHPLLSRLFNIETPSAGDTFTVNVGRINFKDEQHPFDSRHGAVFRALYDLADLEHSRFVLATGQSGNVLSPYYRNLVSMWRSGAYIAIPTAPAALSGDGFSTLTLTPIRDN
ncbi:penicillin acylase family protein [Andreprevotia chitinilytica]|uniref:penicillin acylase family protein n=1 Tax=Andreprevotia chitinilytica TaxID=396808 RepID=UPI000552B55B|nr:penicillin acylase family protein [Andreprevotia chitinilytica]